MSQYFLLSAKARNLSLASVMRMSDLEAETVFRYVRWDGGKPICTHCACDIVYECRHPSGVLRSAARLAGAIFRLPATPCLPPARCCFGPTSPPSRFSSTRLRESRLSRSPVIWTANTKRPSFYPTRRVLKGRHVGGEGETVEVDGGSFGGYVKPANHKENRRDRRLAKNQNGKRQVMVVVRERKGRTLPAVSKSEVDALGFIINRVNPATRLMADEAASWNALHAGFDVARIDHSKAYSTGAGVYINNAEEFSSLMRRSKSGITTTSPGRIWFATPKRAHGARITAGPSTVSRSRPSLGWRRWGRHWLTGTAIGSGPKGQLDVFYLMWYV
jgi:hypothetical protein